MTSSPQYYCLHFIWKQTHWRSDRYWQGRELWDSNSDLSCFGARVLLWSCSVWRGEQRENSFSPPPRPTQACAHLVTLTLHLGIPPTQCKWGERESNSEVFKDCQLFLWPGHIKNVQVPQGPKKWNLISQGFNLPMEFNSTSFPSSHLTLLPTTTTHCINYNQVLECGLHK